MTNQHIADVLALTARLMSLAGENEFKARAYEKAADVIEAFEGPLADIAAAGKLPKLEGVGSSIEAAIKEIVTTGELKALANLQEQVPPGIVALSKIRGLGPKKLQVVWKELNIVTPEALLEACKAGKLEKVKGFGGKIQAGIAQGVEFYLASRGQMRIDVAQGIADALLAILQDCKSVQQAAITGEHRRNCEVVRSVDVVTSCEDTSALVSYLRKHDAIKNIEAKGQMISAKWGSGEYPIKVYSSPPDAFAGTLFLTSTEGEHAAALRHIATTNPSQEEDIYTNAGLQYVLPELRENQGELELAKKSELPRLLEVGDVKGILHAHSTYSDGLFSLREMALACRERGYHYLGITDHSQMAAYAGGLKPETVYKQHSEIDELNKELAPFRIFKGIESDILPDGNLDYTDEVLASFDFVIASIHSGLKMDEKTATERLIKAAMNPYTRIMGHLTGRLLIAREGYPVNHAALIEACAEYGVAIEVNASPYRLDLDWRWLRYATERGVRIAICPDSHSKLGIEDVQYGVRVARKGMLTAAQTLNVLSTDDIGRWFALQAGNRR